jgi:hypothetical protein
LFHDTAVKNKINQRRIVDANQVLISSFLFASCKFPQTSSPIINIASVDDHVPLQNPTCLINTISTLLRTCGYDHDSSKISLQKSQKHQIAIIETDKGKKFIKIKKRSEGIHEYLGMHVFKDFASIIPTEKVILSHNLELAVQPFSSPAESNLLFHKIMALEKNEDAGICSLIHFIFFDSVKPEFRVF